MVEAGGSPLTDQAPQPPPPQYPPQQPAYQQPPYGQPGYTYQAAPSPHGASIASLICGVCGLLFGWIPIVGIIGLGAAIAAIVTGIIGLQHPNGRGLAIAGIICGALTVGLWVIGMVALVALASYHGG